MHEKEVMAPTPSRVGDTITIRVINDAAVRRASRAGISIASRTKAITSTASGTSALSGGTITTGVYDEQEC